MGKIGILFTAIAITLTWSMDVSVAFQKKNSTRPDSVRFRSPETGTVSQILGKVLVIDSKGIRIKPEGKKTQRIPNEFVLSYSINSYPKFSQARRDEYQGKFSEAIKSYSSVARASKAPSWLKRLAMAAKIQCYLATEKESLAVSEFSTLSKSDTKNIPWHAAPLSWHTDPLVNMRVASKVRSWLKSSDPGRALIGASYGLSISQLKAQSIRILKKVANSKLGTATELAKIQLYRVQGNISDDELEELEKQVKALPFEVQAGPMLFLSKQKNLYGHRRQATTGFLLIASQHKNQHQLALLALNDAYYTLENLNDSRQSKIVADWLIRRFPDSIQARSIKNNL